jgi:hypothetical protein
MVKKINLLIVSLCLNLSLGFSDELREDLGINGCSIRDSVTYANKNLSIIACEGPRGIYFSGDFGDSWNFAEGGDYTEGQAYGVTITEFGAYALLNSESMIRTDLGSSDSFTPNWEAVDLGFGTNDRFITVLGLESVNKFIVFGTRSAEVGAIPVAQVLNSETGQIVSSVALPSAGELISIAVVSDFIFAVRRDNFDEDGPNSLYRASFDTSTGIIGTWSDITGNVSAVLIGEFAGGFVDGVYAGSGGAVFVRVGIVGALKQVFRSTDSGNSFIFSFPDTINDGNILGTKYYSPGNFTRACSQGNTTIINSFISKDNGANWSRLKEFISEGFNLFDEDLCMFDPSDSTGNTVLVKRVEGFYKTTNLLAETPDWNSANNGLHGIIVKGVSRVTQPDSDTFAAVTNVGLAITKNFSSASRNWLFPACNGNKSCWSDSIALSAVNPNIIFSGTEDVEIGRMSTTVEGQISIDWEEILDNPSGATDGEDIPVNLIFKDFSEIPNRMFAIYSWNTSGGGVPSGGIYSVEYSSDLNDNTIGSFPVILSGKPIKDLIALNQTTMYAAVNYSTGEQSPPGAKAVYRITLGENGNFTEELDSSGDLGDSPGINVFAYDKTRDTLYAAASDFSFYILTGASTGTGAWEKATHPSAVGRVYAMVVDENSGNIYASRGADIYVSLNQGKKWKLLFTGLTDELFNTISLNSENIPQTEQFYKSDLKIQTTSAKVLGGSSTGLAQLGFESKCKLSVEPKCTDEIDKNQKCLFNVSLSRKIEKSPLGDEAIEIQRKKQGTWETVKTFVTGSKGKAKGKIKIRRQSRFRAKIDTNTVQCTTKSLTVKIKN